MNQALKGIGAVLVLLPTLAVLLAVLSNIGSDEVPPPFTKRS